MRPFAQLQTKSLCFMIVLLCVVESFLETGTPNSNGNRNPTATAIKKPYSNGNQNPTVTAIKHPTATGIQNPILTAIKNANSNGNGTPNSNNNETPNSTGTTEIPESETGAQLEFSKRIQPWNSRNRCIAGIPETDAPLEFPIKHAPQ
jgi:hypothetical protein